MLVALQRARALFPFPILGLDTDNGGEFINEEVAAFCVREQITFTRGRPYEKRDQCNALAEKWGSRATGGRGMGPWGHDRLVGVHASLQLDELYRALHWYVNCFQPRVLLVSKQIEGRKIRRTYDTAKTPLQRVISSGVVPSTQQQELRAIGKAFDPLRLFQQVEQLQQATLRCEAVRSSAGQPMPPTSLVPFDLTACAAELVLQEGSETDEIPHEEQRRASALDWRRTSKDPFAGRWKQILAWVQANPTRSSGDILRELQSLYPGRYERSYLRTLQRGMRKIRTHLLRTHEGAASRAEPQANLSLPAELEAFPEAGRCRPCPPAVSSPSAAHPSSPEQSQHLTIERAVKEYLQAHCEVGHRLKTLEWHQTVLGHFQQYVLTECHLLLVNQIAETTICNWLAFLAQAPTARGSQRMASTVETYARSARAFFGWLIERGMLSCSPMSERAFPRTRVPLPQVVSPATFDQAMRAGFPRKEKAPGAMRMAARDQALLWVLFETGMTGSEVCALRVADLDLQAGRLACEGKRRPRAPDASRGDLPEPPACVYEADGADHKERAGEKTNWRRSAVRFQGEAAAHQERRNHGVCPAPHTSGAQ